MTKNKQTLSPEEQELKKRLKKIEERVDTLEQTTTKPLYEYRSSIIGDDDPPQNKKAHKSESWKTLKGIAIQYILPFLAIGALVGGIVLSLGVYPLTSYPAIIIISIAILLISIFLFVNAQLLKKNAPNWSFICFNGGIILVSFLLYTLTVTYKLIAPSLALVILGLLTVSLLMFLKNKNDGFVYLLFLLGAYIGVACIIISHTHLLAQSICFLIVGNILFMLGIRLELLPFRILAYVSWAYGLIALILTHILKYFYSSFNYNDQRLAFIIWIILMTTAYIRAHKNYKKLNRLEQSIVPSSLMVLALLVPIYWIFIELLHFFGPLSCVSLALSALVLYGIGIKQKNHLLRYTAYWIYLLGLVVFAFYYKYYQLLHPYWTVELSVLFISFLIPLLIIVIAQSKIRTIVPTQEFKLTTHIAWLGILLLLFFWGSALIILQFDQLQKAGSIFLRPFFEYSLKDSKLIRTPVTEYLLILYTFIVACIALFIGFKHNDKLFKIVGLFFTLWIILKFLGIIFNRFPGYPILIIVLGIFLSLTLMRYYWSKKTSE